MHSKFPYKLKYQKFHVNFKQQLHADLLMLLSALQLFCVCLCVPNMSNIMEDERHSYLCIKWAESRYCTNNGSFKWVNVHVIECNHRTSYHHMAFYFQPLCDEMNKQHRQTLFFTIKTHADQSKVLFLKYLSFLGNGRGTSHHYPNSYMHECIMYGWVFVCC